MNPSLQSLRRFLLVMLIWLLITAAMTYLFSLDLQMAYRDAALFTAPQFLFLFVLLTSVWYVCKATPLEGSKYLLLMRHGASLIFIVLIWLAVSYLYAELLVRLYPVKNWPQVLNASLRVNVVIAAFFYFVVGLLNYFVIVLERAREAEERALQNRIAAVQAELKALKSTIHPHFLFNSFAALDSLIRSDPDQARRVCIRLSDFLRYSIKYGEKKLVTLADEIGHVQNYLEVEKIRFGDRLKIDISAPDEVMPVAVPPFILLPLMENAVKHGISQILGSCEISLDIKVRDNQLIIENKNPYDPQAANRPDSGTGLENLRRRLETIYKQEIYIRVIKKQGVATACIKLPLRAGKPTDEVQTAPI